MGKHWTNTPPKQWGGEKMNRNCWRKNEKQRVGNTVPTKRLEGNASSFFCLFYIFLGPYGSVPLALKFLALDWLYCPWCLPHPHSSACTPHSVWPASRAPTTTSASHTALATCRSVRSLSLQERAQSEPAATTSVRQELSAGPRYQPFRHTEVMLASSRIPPPNKMDGPSTPQTEYL